tara:strand:- start:12662 stop:13054 length:393 start_codon:yes stop_codon:yes gene_type:complete
MGLKKTYAGGKYTEAKMRSFITSALRRCRYPVKYDALKLAFVKDGINPKTGRKCKLHKCAECKELFPASSMQIDHIEPVVPLEGFDNPVFLGYDWNEYIQRLFCDVKNFQAVCKPCHKMKSAEERKMRRK